MGRTDFGGWCCGRDANRKYFRCTQISKAFELVCLATDAARQETQDDVFSDATGVFSMSEDGNSPPETKIFREPNNEMKSIRSKREQSAVKLDDCLLLLNSQLVSVEPVLYKYFTAFKKQWKNKRSYNCEHRLFEYFMYKKKGSAYMWKLPSVCVLIRYVYFSVAIVQQCWTGSSECAQNSIGTLPTGTQNKTCHLWQPKSILYESERGK